jgi:hypothetical protein
MLKYPFRGPRNDLNLTEVTISKNGEVTRVEAGSTQCLDVKPDHTVRGVYKYGDLALQVGIVSNLGQ